MLSDRGLSLILKLIENNHTPVTSKKLATELGVSERSVKTYVKEVSEYCEKHNMELKRQAGVGFCANFTEEQVASIEGLKSKQRTVMSQQQRLNYIEFILLSGWDTYTLALFSDELNVSKKVISDDIALVENQLERFDIKVKKTAGLGIYIEGKEFDIRNALHHCTKFPIGNKNISKIYDYRLSAEHSNLWINNFSQVNYECAVDLIHKIEADTDVIYTDYSFQMLVEYFSIFFFRIRNGSVLEEKITNQDADSSEGIDVILNIIKDRYKQEINAAEKSYLNILLASAEIQDSEHHNQKSEESIAICENMLEYLTQIFGVNLNENKMLAVSLEAFLKSSIIRTRYGIEVTNPFLTEITEIYSGIFATCFTLSKYYEQYCGKIPSDHEIAFLALMIGGAMHHNQNNIKAILVGTGGLGATSLVAAKLENKISDIKIVAILTSDKLGSLESYDYDIVISLTELGKEYDEWVKISPIVGNRDIKIIKDKCFEVLADKGAEKSEFSKLIEAENIIMIEEEISKKEAIKLACNKLIEEGYVTKEYLKDVLDREKVEATSIGNWVAIPHGKPEHVVKPKVQIVRLAKGINWGDRQVDLIFLLALNFNNVASTKMFFQDFTRIMGEDESINDIRQAKSPNELEMVIKEKLHWS